MIYLTLNGVEFGITWSYERKSLSNPRDITVCEVVKEPRTDKAVLFGLGVAACSEKDQFRKEYGRKLSLRRAMAWMNWDRPTRISVWEAYHERTRNGGVYQPRGASVETATKRIEPSNGAHGSDEPPALDHPPRD